LKKHESNLVVLSVMLCWASAYVFIKGLPPELSDFGYLALMNGIAALILIVIFAKRFRYLNKSNIKHGVILGLLMMLVLMFEKAGVDRLTASSASILTSLDILIVPTLMLIFYRRRPPRKQMVAIGFILAGIISTNGLSLKDFPIVGTLFMLGDCICMSLYTVVANKFCKKDDAILLAVNQIVTMAIVAMILWTIEEPGMIFRLHYTPALASSLFVLALFTKAYSYIILMYGQAYADPVDVVIIFALEPVATMLLAVLIPSAFGGVEESFSITTMLGAFLIAIGAVIGEVDIKRLIKRFRGGARFAKTKD